MSCLLTHQLLLLKANCLKKKILPHFGVSMSSLAKFLSFGNAHTMTPLLWEWGGVCGFLVLPSKLIEMAGPHLSSPSWHMDI